MRCLLISFLAVTSLVSAGPIAGGACANGTLADYLALGADGCTSSQGVHFYSFTYSSLSTAASDIAVTFYDQDSGFAFDGWRATDRGTIDISMGFLADLSATVNPMAGGWAVYVCKPLSSCDPSPGGTVTGTVTDEFDSFSNTAGPGVGFGNQYDNYTAGWPGISTPHWDVNGTADPGKIITVQLQTGYLDPVLNGSPTPEPTTLPLVGAGLLLGGWKCKRT